MTAMAASGWQVLAVDACDTAADVGAAASTGLPPPSRADLTAVAGRAQPAAVPVVADVCDLAAMERAAARAVSRFGRIDALVCAAGVLAGGRPLWEVDPREWEVVIRTDLTGVWHSVRAAVPHILRSRGPRRVVAVASAAGSRGLPLLGAYSAAKSGVIGLVRSLAADLSGTGATANAVSPGSTRTEMLEASARVYGLDSSGEFARQQRPLGRLIDPPEVAAAVCWLCSEAASAVTGSVLTVDGGMTGVIH